MLLKRVTSAASHHYIRLSSGGNGVQTASSKQAGETERGDTVHLGKVRADYPRSHLRGDTGAHAQLRPQCSSSHGVMHIMSMTNDKQLA